MKPRRGPRVALGLALLILSLIYFATLFWGPEGAETDEQRNHLRDLGDAPSESTEAVAPGGAGDQLGRRSNQKPRPSSRTLMSNR